MADLQTQFNKFHEAIKIDFEGNEPLREKRDIILDALRAGLKKKYPTDTPTFDSFNQGSYDVATGVEPLEGEDYDIDVGIVFNIPKDNNKPVGVKEVVFEILNAAYQRKVEIKKPCVRVQYHKAGEKAYHIDLAVYSRGTNRDGSFNDTIHIAKGKPSSLADDKFWEISEPHKLKTLIKSKFSDNSDREQFRRIIRYLKRWKDWNFPSSGNSRPTGIALTALCYDFFSVEKTPFLNTKTNSISYRYNDALALLNTVKKIINQFNNKDNISVKLPVKPKNDLFEKMTNIQMSNFKQKLETLKDKLESSMNDKVLSTACEKLIKVFGDDFPTS